MELSNDHCHPRVLLAIDGSAGSAAAVQSVAEGVWPAGTVVRLFSAYEDVAGSIPSEVMDLMAEAVDILGEAGIVTEVGMRAGNAGSAILAEADRWHADWIILGANGNDHGCERAGSVTLSVVRRARCSVQVIRRKNDETFESEVPLYGYEPLDEERGIDSGRVVARSLRLARAPRRVCGSRV